jgi:RNA polymerase sigma factor (sigma-70 family)
MMQLCLRYTKNESDATEVLNNGFLKVFRNIHKYEPVQAGIYTWIRIIIINSCIDFIKQKIKIKHRELEEATDVQINADVIEKMDALQLLQLIRQLPPATQAVFNLYVIEGYNHKEIAKLLSISEGTSKWHLSEARKKLQQMILLQEVNYE